MKRRSLGSPEITPLIDVVFLLLVFFMVSSVFKKHEPGLELQLPKSSSITTIMHKKELKIEMTPQEIALNGERCSMETLNERLMLLGKQHHPVSLYIDESVNYKRIMSLLDLLQRHGLFDIALISQSTKAVKKLDK